jgi:hypothetical protein
MVLCLINLTTLLNVDIERYILYHSACSTETKCMVYLFQNDTPVIL